MISEEKKTRKLFGIVMAWKKKKSPNRPSTNRPNTSSHGGRQSPKPLLDLLNGTKNEETGPVQEGEGQADILILPEFSDEDGLAPSDALLLVDWILDKAFQIIADDEAEDLAFFAEAEDHKTEEFITKSILLEFLSFCYAVFDEEKRLAKAKKAAVVKNNKFAIVAVPEGGTIPSGLEDSSFISADDSMLSFKFQSPVLDEKDLITSNDWEIVHEIQWIQVLREHPPFVDCLFYFPTSMDGMIGRDELVQVSYHRLLLFIFVPLTSSLIDSFSLLRLW
jgi:hypothetical protein